MVKVTCRSISNALGQVPLGEIKSIDIAAAGSQIRVGVADGNLQSGIDRHLSAPFQVSPSSFFITGKNLGGSDGVRGIDQRWRVTILLSESDRSETPLDCGRIVSMQHTDVGMDIVRNHMRVPLFYRVE